MLNFDSLILFIISSVVIVACPGPSNLYVLSRSIADGRKAGITAALGLALGSLTYGLMMATGLSALFLNKPTAFLIAKYLGAIYLTYLGIRYLQSQSSPTTKVGHSPTNYVGMLRILRESYITEIINPKVGLFFVSFLPQFLNTSTEPAPLNIYYLSITYVFIAFLIDSLVALAAGTLAAEITVNRTISRLLNISAGVILIALGGKLLFLPY